MSIVNLLSGKLCCQSWHLPIWCVCFFSIFWCTRVLSHICINRPGQLCSPAQWQNCWFFFTRKNWFSYALRLRCGSMIANLHTFYSEFRSRHWFCYFVVGNAPRKYIQIGLENRKFCYAIGYFSNVMYGHWAFSWNIFANAQVECGNEVLCCHFSCDNRRLALL